jgi:hypothetical protein
MKHSNFQKLLSKSLDPTVYAAISLKTQVIPGWTMEMLALKGLSMRIHFWSVLLARSRQGFPESFTKKFGQAMRCFSNNGKLIPANRKGKRIS